MLASVMVEWRTAGVQDPFRKATLLVDCMHGAASMLRERGVEATCDGEVLHIVLAAARCWRANDLRRMIKLRKRCHELCEVFDVEGNLTDEKCLSQHIRRLATATIAEQLREAQAEEAEGGEDGGGLPGKARRRSLHRRLTARSPKRKRVKGLDILDDDGAPITDAEKATDEVHRHWSWFFARRPGDPEARERLLGRAARFQGDLRPIPFADFCGIVTPRKDSAPGPDGIPFSAWAVPIAELHECLYSCYLQMCGGRLPPQGFNESLMTMIPKGDFGDIDGDFLAGPGGIRPLSLANIAQKLVAAAANHSLAIVAAEIACDRQRGFLKGRLISEAVLEMEGALYRLAQQTSDKRPGGMFLDRKAAFASVSHEWLRGALVASGVPGWLTDLVDALYDDGDALLQLGSAECRRIVIASGIHQGCPASGTLWAIIFDPVLRGLALDTDGVVCGFADDIGIAMRNLLTGVPAWSLFGGRLS